MLYAVLERKGRRSVLVDARPEDDDRLRGTRIVRRPEREEMEKQQKRSGEHRPCDPKPPSGQGAVVERPSNRREQQIGRAHV